MRDAHLPDIWRCDVDHLQCVEVIAEHWVANPHVVERQMGMLAKFGAPILHCISLSPGSPAPPPSDVMRAVGALVERVQPECLGDHACITRVPSGDIGHLTPLSPGPESARFLVENIKNFRSAFGVPFALENIAALVRLPGPWTVWQMLAHVMDKTDATLLMDLENLHADVVNFGEDAAKVFAELPLERVTHVHLAGGHRRGMRYVDSHSAPVPDDTHALLTGLIRAGARPHTIIVERDNHLPPFAELLEDLRRARAAYELGLHREAA